MSNLRKKVKQLLLLITAICFWILVWHFCAKKIDSNIFLPSPGDTFRALNRLIRRGKFWRIVCNSFMRIIKGLGLAVICGILLAVLSECCRMIKVLLYPLMSLIKAVPVASFIILALLWIKSENLSVMISFIMVLPVIYINVLQGFEHVDRGLLEVAKVYRVPYVRRICFVYIHGIYPSFIAGCRISLGFCFKSGIAAEIIGLPMDTIGSELYKAKLYLLTEEMFAWTVVVILMSIFFEGICIYILNRVSKIVPGTWFMRRKQNQRRACGINTQGQNPGGGKEILIENMSKSYGKQSIFDNVSLKLNTESPVCIMGESGIGKTTLVKIICGLVKPDKGNIYLSTDDITVVFQENRLIEDMDILSNIYYVCGKSVSEEELGKHLKYIGLAGLEHKKISELSGGMKRRVAIIRAVIKESDIILLDEPFKGLDRVSREIAIEYIRKYCRDRIIILVSHDEEEANLMGAEIIKMEDIVCP